MNTNSYKIFKNLALLLVCLALSATSNADQSECDPLECEPLKVVWKHKSHSNGCVLTTDFYDDPGNTYRANFIYVNRLSREELSDYTQAQVDTFWKNRGAILEIKTSDLKYLYKPYIKLNSSSIMQDEILHHEVDRRINDQVFYADMRVMQRVLDALLNMEVIYLQMETEEGVLKYYEIQPGGFAQQYDLWLECRETFLSR